MAKGQRLKPEQIVTLLRQIDVLTTNGKTLAQACNEVGMVVQSYYRWQNGFCESFNSTFRDNLLDGEIFYSHKDTWIIVGEWVEHYNHIKPHSALG